MNSKPPVLKKSELALLSNAVFDVPAKVRYLILVAGGAAIIFLIGASLVGDSTYTVEVDKILHFIAYGSLALLFTASLRPTLYLPALIGLGILGCIIELLQPFNGRTADVDDAIANVFGLLVGAFIGLTGRWIFSVLRKELANHKARKRIRQIDAGAGIFDEGDEADHFFIIRSGRVSLQREVDGRTHQAGNLGPGDVLGGIPVIRGTGQVFTATAKEDCELYRMNLDDLLDSAGGRQQPVAAVLMAFSDYLSEIVDHWLRAESTLAGIEEEQLEKHGQAGN